MLTDPVADLLSRIRNAAQAKHVETTCPASKLKLAVCQVLRDEGFIDDVESGEEDGRPVLRIRLRYGNDGQSLIDGIRRVSRPSLRVYVGAKEIKPVRGGLGVAVLSTPKGVLSDRVARENNVGGEVMCEVW